MECKLDENLKSCNCSYISCSRKGKCCECLRNHLSKKQVPACFFPNEAEKTFNRSLDFFISLINKN